MLAWQEHLDAVRDDRQAPRVPTGVVTRSVVAMFLARLGSLNALEQSRESTFWTTWLGRLMPSADTVGRVCAGMDLEDVRVIGHQLYARLKRMKALAPLAYGWVIGLLDGHESHATYRRHCGGCLQRVIHAASGDRIQYYHRYVTLLLVARDLHLLLDAEPIRPGEDEIAAAIRLLDRVLPDYPRAFDLLVGDSLYADSRFFNYVVRQGKHALAVLKQEKRDLYEDAQSLFAKTPPVVVQEGKRQCAQWDIEGFTTWPQVDAPVRVVRSIEDWTVRRQLTDEDETMHSQWVWVTTSPQAQVPTRGIAVFGHARSKIENEGYNELVNRQYADHVYKHDPHAMLVLYLLAMFCLNVLLAFYRRNLKPAVRRAASMLHIGRRIAAELYAGIEAGPARAPT